MTDDKAQNRVHPRAALLSNTGAETDASNQYSAGCTMSYLVAAGDQVSHGLCHSVAVSERLMWRVLLVVHAERALPAL